MDAKQQNTRPRNKGVCVSFWIPVTEKQALEQAAERAGDAGRSAVMRAALREYIGKQVEQTANA